MGQPRFWKALHTQLYFDYSRRFSSHSSHSKEPEEAAFGNAATDGTIPWGARLENDQVRGNLRKKEEREREISAELAGRENEGKKCKKGRVKRKTSVGWKSPSPNAIIIFKLTQLLFLFECYCEI